MSDVTLFNANVITMDPAFPYAQLISIQNGKISAVLGDGSLSEFRKRNTKLIDCKGKTVLPGFIDAHFHLFGFAESLITTNLGPRNGIHSISDIQERIREQSQQLPPGTWIRGRGYNEFYLTEKRHPNRWDLDSATTIHPIKLTHRSARAYVLNSLALKLAGISKETADPPEGLIDRDLQTGEPTGLLFGMADYLGKVIPPLEPGQMELGIELAGRELCALGITSIHDVSPRNDLDRWKLIQRWKKDGRFKTRVRVMLGKKGFEEYHRRPFPTQVDEHQVSIGGIKTIVHETTGQLSPDPFELNEIVLNVHRMEFQAVLHAIEGKTIKAACDAVEYALNRYPRANHRHRIEHCSVCTPSLAKRIASLGIMVITQPSFIFYNGDRYLRTVPDFNLRHLYPIRTLMENNVIVAGSSDCPIVPGSPLIGIYSAIFRRTDKGQSILPEEGISPVEALKLYTEYAAKAAYEDNIKGSITPGKLADLVVLSADPTKLPADEVKNIKVEMTLINGDVVFDETG